MKSNNTESKSIFIALVSLFAFGMLTLVFLPEAEEDQIVAENQTERKSSQTYTALDNFSDYSKPEHLESTLESEESLFQNGNAEESESEEILTDTLQDYDPSIVQLTITSDVLEREPVDDLDSVDLHSGQFYTHTVVNSEQESGIQHVYYFDGNEIARVPMNVGTSPSWRCWSSKNIDPHLWKGEWRVDIESNTGTVLTSQTFDVLEMHEQQNPPPLAEQVSSLP